jgi:membrane fusion protein, multidrug efflux system
VKNKAERVDVKTGRESDGSIEIYGNLHPGDLLMRAASDEIRTGATMPNIKTVTP